jgi:hypothetical protein
MSEWGCQSLSGGKFRTWQRDIDGARTSEALFDPYSFAHAFVGSLQFFLIPPPGTLPWLYAFLINLYLHVAFEFVENTPFVIRVCRATTVDKEYRGDTVVNSLGDILSFAAAYFATLVLWTLAPWATFLIPMACLVIFLSFYSRSIRG